MNLDPRQTDAFKAVIDTGSFEKAAIQLRLTASAITQRVRALEVVVGAPLVIRTRPCRSTRIGQRVLQYLQRAALLQSDLANDLSLLESAPLAISVALNADSLGTWFFPALASILSGEKILLDVLVEDQDHTYPLLESGVAAGCVSTEVKPMRGCSAEPLGAMRYRLVASRGFQEQWFPDGMTRATASQAPTVCYTVRDTLQSDFLLARFGLPDGSYPRHQVPGTDAHFLAVCHGLGYAMIPELLLDSPAAARYGLVELAPDHPTDVDLYWHAWQLQSPRLEQLSQRLVKAARSALRQIDPAPRKRRASVR